MESKRIKSNFYIVSEKGHGLIVGSIVELGLTQKQLPDWLLLMKDSPTLVPKAKYPDLYEVCQDLYGNSTKTHFYAFPPS